MNNNDTGGEGFLVDPGQLQFELTDGMEVAVQQGELSEVQAGLAFVLKEQVKISLIAAEKPEKQLKFLCHCLMNKFHFILEANAKGKMLGFIFLSSVSKLILQI